MVDGASMGRISPLEAVAVESRVRIVLGPVKILLVSSLNLVVLLFRGGEYANSFPAVLFAIAR